MPGMKTLLTVAALASSVVGCVTARSGLTEKQIEEIRARDEEQQTQKIVLGDGDVIDVRVYREPDLGGIYRVTREKVDFPLIGAVELHGRDVTAVAEEVRARYEKDYLKNAQVSVFLKEHNSRKVHVTGQVVKPGSFAFEAGMTVIQAVANAGGLGKLAASNDVKITRVVNGEQKTEIVRVGDIQRGNAPDYALAPGDIVFVPEAIF